MAAASLGRRRQPRAVLGHLCCRESNPPSQPASKPRSKAASEPGDAGQGSPPSFPAFACSLQGKTLPCFGLAPVSSAAIAVSQSVGRRSVLPKGNVV